MTCRLAVLPAVLVSGRHRPCTPRSGLCFPAKPQNFTWRLRESSHAISISLFSMFCALRLCFSCLFSLLLLACSHVRSDRKNWDILSLLSVEQAGISQKPANWWMPVKHFCQTQEWKFYQGVIYCVTNHICISPRTVSSGSPSQCFSSFIVP